MIIKILERSDPTFGAQRSARVRLFLENACFIPKKSTLVFHNSSEIALFLPSYYHVPITMNLG